MQTEQLTGPTAFIRTSRTSSQPLNESTSNNASIASPILSKLKRLGFALKLIKLNEFVYRFGLYLIICYLNYQTRGTSIAGYDSFEPSFSFILVTKTRLINTPTQSSRLVIVGSLQRANLEIDIEFDEFSIRKFHLIPYSPSTIKLNTVAGKYEHQQYKQSRYQQNFLETTT